MQILKNDRRESSFQADAELAPSTFNIAEMGSLHLPSLRDLEELGRDLSVVPLEKQFPVEASKFEGPEPYAREWVNHKLVAGLTFFCSYACIKMGIEGVSLLADSNFASSALPLGKTIFFAFGATQLFKLSRFNRELREQSIARAATIIPDKDAGSGGEV